MKKDDAYFPSAYNVSKYGTYFRYLFEYIRFRDFKSLKASWNYLFRGIPPAGSWKAKSRLGTFNIRKGTNDFLFINYAYERKVRDYLEREHSKITCFIDIGACIGEFCVWLARKGVRCIAFEPVNYEAAKNNIELNGVSDKVTLYNLGLGNKEKKVFFDVKQVVTSSSHVDKTRIDQPGNIQISTLDTVLPEGTFSENDNIVIKLDVEGMELEVLEGAENMLRTVRNLSVIFEHTVSGNDEIKEKLLQTGNFEFVAIDGVNTLAKKIII